MKTNILTMIAQAEVAWKPLGEVTKYEQPTRYLVKSTNYQDDYDIPVLTAGKTFILGYTNEIEGIYIGSRNPVIIFDDFTTANKWVDFDFKVKSSAMKMITSDDETKYKLKYIYYWLNTLPIEENTDHKRQWISNFSNKLIPIPPLELQKEIVKRLDILTELEATLEATLEAELALRKKQYQYYRNLLLTFDDISDIRGGKTNPFFSKDVVWKSLGEVGEVRMCKRILKEQTTNIGDIPFYKIGTFGKEANAFISRELFENYKNKYPYPKLGEILISASGTIGRTVIFDGKDAYFQDSNIVWIENDEREVLNKYLFYFYQIANWNIAEGGTIQRLYNDNLKKVKIPIPPLETQAKIVAILDKFDRLTSSITEGLPKEIELRCKQYEYYRELLLGFSQS